MSDIAVWIADVLRSSGVRMIFGVPGGGGNLDLIEAARGMDLPFVLTSTETAGAIAAIAQAEITRAAGACLTTLGPGAASVVNGVACAHLERAPIFVLTDDLATTHPQYAHQRLPHRAMFEGITAYSGSLLPDTARCLGEAASWIAELPPGPVHINCPGDFVTAAAPEAFTRTRTKPEAHGPISGRLEHLLRGARKPLVIAGLGARGAADAQAIRSFCENRHVPAMVTYKAKGVIPDRHDWFAGVFTNASIEGSIVRESDLILGLGLDPVELLPRPWPYQMPIVYLGPWDVPDDHVPFDAREVGDIASAMPGLEAGMWISDWDQEWIANQVEAARKAIDIAAPGLTAQRVVQLAAERLAARGRVTVDAGAHMFPATMLWPVNEPNGMLISNGLSTMGFALPAAVGASLLERDRLTVALTGDGGLLMCLGELLTAVRERLRILTIVFADDSLSLIEIKQAARKLPPAGVALGEMDWVSVARGFGVAGYAASTDGELAAAIDAAAQHEGPSLVAARIDRSNYGAIARAIRG